MRRDCEPPLIKIEPTSAVAAVRDGGGGVLSASRIGSHVQSSGRPRIDTQVAGGGGFAYLFDIVPELSGGRVLSLTSDADKSTSLTLSTSYLSSDPSEVTVLDTDISAPAVPTSYERAHSLLVQFGAGDVRHAFEIDVAEGSSCNAPGHHIDVTLLDYTFNREQEDAISPGQDQSIYRSLRSFASLAAGVNPQAARLTQKVYAPYQVTVDLADPPAVDEYLRQLLDAFVEGTYIF